MAKSKAVATKQSPGALTNWRDRAKQSISTRKEVNNKLPGGGGLSLSLRGGEMKIGGENQDNPLPMIILASAPIRAYYEKAWKDGSKDSPTCYSFDTLRPHTAVEEPENDVCKSCPNNAFGSARQGTGKACQEGVRLAFITADVLDSPESIPDSPIVTTKLSVLNTKHWKKYTEAFGEDDALWQWVTGLKNQPDGKSQYKVSFARTHMPQDDSIMAEIAGRVDEAEALLVQPFPKPGAEEQAPAKSDRPRKFQKPGAKK